TSARQAGSSRGEGAQNKVEADPGLVTSGGAPPKFSRTAIVGAAWAPLFFIFGLTYFWASVPVAVDPGSKPAGPEWWQVILMFTLLPLGLAAPFATTILGWISVSQIRQARGRLCGLGLAVFDGLLFALLALDFAFLTVAANFAPVANGPSG